MIERRKFRRTEVAWVARMLNVNRAEALQLMDRLYRVELTNQRRTNPLAESTWCVKFFHHQGGTAFALMLVPEAADAAGPLLQADQGFPAGTPCKRYYFREA